MVQTDNNNENNENTIITTKIITTTTKSSSFILFLFVQCICAKQVCYNHLYRKHIHKMNNESYIERASERESNKKRERERTATTGVDNDYDDGDDAEWGCVAMFCAL